MATKIERFVLRYVVTVVSGEFINVAVIVHAPEAGFCDMRIRDDWDTVLCFDPDADVPMLQALLTEMRQSLRSPTERQRVLSDLREVFSNTLQSSDPCEYVIAVEPETELEKWGQQMLKPKRSAQPDRHCYVAVTPGGNCLGEIVETAGHAHWLT